MKWFRRIAMTGCTLLLFAWLLVITALDQQNSGMSAGIRPPNPIVGVWKGQHGVIMDLRPDGTARSRSTDSQASSISYFRYRLNPDGFFADDSAKPNEYIGRLMQTVLGTTSDRFDVAKLSDSELRLIDSSGRALIFARSKDSELATAP